MSAETAERHRRGQPASVRVHQFASLAGADGGHELTADLRRLIEGNRFPRRAWVNLWDARSSHQYLLLPSARASELEAGAHRHGAAALGLNEAEVTVSTKIGARRGEPGHKSKTEVSFFAARSDEIRQRLRPIYDAGFVVEGVTTPCGALWSQARLRRPSLPGQVDAHVALGPNQSALGIFSNGLLLYARDLEWGYATTPFGAPIGQAREEISKRLSLELRRSFLYLKQFWEDDVSQVLLCGEMPELRSLVAPLIERLNVEVETLDTLEGLDTSSLPDGFAEQAATYRLASSIAADPPPVNLLPLEATAHRTRGTGRQIFAVGSAAAVALTAMLYAQAGVHRAEAERQLLLLQRETAGLPSSIQPVTATEVQPDLETAQRAVLGSLDAQGPAVARLLENVANASPDELTVRAVRVAPGGETWTVTVDAFAAGSDIPRARAVADRFLRALEEAQGIGELLQFPTRRIVAASGGIELTATYRVRR